MQEVTACPEYEKRNYSGEGLLPEVTEPDTTFPVRVGDSAAQADERVLLLRLGECAQPGGVVIWPSLINPAMDCARNEPIRGQID
jgi:hypothetical protein